MIVRNLNLKNLGEEGKYSYEFNNENGEIKRMKDFIYIFRDQNEIEIYFNQWEIKQVFFSIHEFKENVLFVKELFKHIAHHEYGHTFLAPTTFDLGIKEAKEFFKKFGYHNSRDVPIEKKNEFLMIYSNSEFIRALLSLNRVELTRVYDEFKEFHAYYMVLKEKISNSNPEDALNWNYNILTGYVTNLYNQGEEMLSELKQSDFFQDVQLNKFPHDAYFELYHDIMQLTYDFFIYGEWNRLIGLFSENNMTYFLDFMQTINEIFKTIADKHSDIDVITKIIIQLSKKMDDINYEDLIFNNQVNEKHQKELKKFIMELEQDELILDESL
ncbi:hypothetical protein LCGC14_0930610 [marine sediment metagenome]|uniref:Uncharacterized protein n=1 Tax=marine sediment metagenome TaxID=412755 RepID=A0A0F9RUL9_9ZZZZ